MTGHGEGSAVFRPDLIVKYNVNSTKLWQGGVIPIY